MPEKIEILDIKVDNVKIREARDRIDEYIRDYKVNNLSDEPGRLIVTPNSEMIVRAQDDNHLAQILNQADLSIPDGAGVVLASRILNKSLPERVAGFDFMQELLSLAVTKNYSVYLLGGKPRIIKKVQKEILSEYKGIEICGCHHGYLDNELEHKVLTEINNLQPDFLFVGMGVPLQEKFLDRNLKKLKVKVAMTVGGSFDVLAGEVKRAPLWMQKFCLEWFYRLWHEPSRLGRMLALPKFMVLVLIEAGKKIWQN